MRVDRQAGDVLREERGRRPIRETESAVGDDDLPTLTSGGTPGAGEDPGAGPRGPAGAVVSVGARPSIARRGTRPSWSRSTSTRGLATRRRSIRISAGQRASIPVARASGIVTAGRAGGPSRTSRSPACPRTVRSRRSRRRALTTSAASAVPRSGAAIGSQCCRGARAAPATSTVRSRVRRPASAEPRPISVPASGSSATTSMPAGAPGGQARALTPSRKARRSRRRGGATPGAARVGAPSKASRPTATAPSLTVRSRSVKASQRSARNGAGSPRQATARSVTAPLPPIRAPVARR